MSEASNKQPSAWQRFWRGIWLFIVWLVRLIIAIGGGLLLGIGIWYVANVGVPQFYAQVLNPIQVNTVKLDIVQSDLQSTRLGLNEELRAARDDIRTLRQTVNDQQVVINTLVAELDGEKANREQAQTRLDAAVQGLDETAQYQTITLGQVQTAIADSDASLAEATTALGTRLGALEGSLSTMAEEATALDGSVAALATNLDAVKQDVAANGSGNAELAKAIALLETDLTSLSDELVTTQTGLAEVTAIYTMPVTLSDSFERRLVLMQAWQEIMRARLHLLEKNAGLATESLNLALANVDKFLALSTDLTAAAMAPIQERAATAAILLETDPFLAAQELEIIWYRLEDMISAPILPAATPAEAAVEEPAAETAVETTETTTEEAATEEEATTGETGTTTGGSGG